MTSKTQRGTYQLGNVIDATWNARLSEQLGHYKAELIHPVAAHCLSYPMQLLGLSSVCALLDSTLGERDPHPELFDTTMALIRQIITQAVWIPDYIRFEIALLSELGFRLELTHCVVTGQTNDLIYVSPRSGRAVSAAAGQPYTHLLLPLPQFLVQDTHPSSVNNHDMKNGLELGAYFLNKYIMNTHAISLPATRIRLYDMVSKHSATQTASSL